MFLSIQLGNYRGNRFASKPMFLIAVIDAINKHTLLENKIIYTDKNIRLNFENIYKHYNKVEKVSLHTFLNPYYHLASSPFYHLVWKSTITPPPMANLPTVNFLKENLLYAQFDKELWKILQDERSRNDLRQCLINEYMNDN